MMSYSPIYNHHNLHSSPGIILFMILTVVISASCGTDAAEPISISGAWFQAGLSEESVNVIKTSGGAVYVATDNDLFRSYLPDIPEWATLGMIRVMEEDEWVRDFMVYNESEIVGVVGHSPAGDTDYLKTFVPLFYTSDGGEHWQAMENEFTEHNAVVNRLAATPDLDTLYALNGGNVARSLDRGWNWTPFYWRDVGDEWTPHTNSWFLEVDQQNTHNIWQGGMTVLFNPYVRKSNDGGLTWEHKRPFEGMIEGFAMDIAINRNHSDHVLLAMGEVAFSPDGGESWAVSYHRSEVRVLENSIRFDHVVYGSGAHPTGNLYLAVSSDFGKSWDTLLYEESPPDVVVNDMAVDVIDGKETIYLGTNKGVFSFSVD
jgi:hypothetical protein